MGSTYKKSLLAIMTLILVMFFQNCGNYSFSPIKADLNQGNNGTDSVPNPNPNPNPPPPSPCTPQTATNLRVMFLVDASGSTTNDDPDADVRASSVSNFLTANAAATNLSYSYTYFAADEDTFDFTAMNFTGTPSANVFGNPTQEATALTDFVSLFKNGKIQENGTDYQDAFTAVQSLVVADEKANPGYSYVVVFMSDGQPNRGPSDVAGVEGLVTNLLTAAGSTRVTVSSVYFENSPDAGEETLMTDIAKTGNGQYINGNSQTLNLQTMIQNIIVVPPNSCATN